MQHVCATLRGNDVTVKRETRDGVTKISRQVVRRTGPGGDVSGGHKTEGELLLPLVSEASFDWPLFNMERPPSSYQHIPLGSSHNGHAPADVTDEGDQKQRPALPDELYSECMTAVTGDRLLLGRLSSPSDYGSASPSTIGRSPCDTINTAHCHNDTLDTVTSPLSATADSVFSEQPFEHATTDNRPKMPATGATATGQLQSTVQPTLAFDSVTLFYQSEPSDAMEVMLEEEEMRDRLTAAPRYPYHTRRCHSPEEEVDRVLEATDSDYSRGPADDEADSWDDELLTSDVTFSDDGDDSGSYHVTSDLSLTFDDLEDEGSYECSKAQSDLLLAASFSHMPAIPELTEDELHHQHHYTDSESHVSGIDDTSFTDLRICDNSDSYHSNNVCLPADMDVCTQEFDEVLNSLTNRTPNTPGNHGYNDTHQQPLTTRSSSSSSSSSLLSDNTAVELLLPTVHTSPLNNNVHNATSNSVRQGQGSLTLTERYSQSQEANDLQLVLASTDIATDIAELTIVDSDDYYEQQLDTVLDLMDIGDMSRRGEERGAIVMEDCVTYDSQQVDEFADVFTTEEEFTLPAMTVPVEGGVQVVESQRTRLADSVHVLSAEESEHAHDVTVTRRAARLVPESASSQHHSTSGALLHINIDKQLTSTSRDSAIEHYITDALKNSEKHYVMPASPAEPQRAGVVKSDEIIVQEVVVAFSWRKKKPSANATGTADSSSSSSTVVSLADGNNKPIREIQVRRQFKVTDIPSQPAEG